MSTFTKIKSLKIEQEVTGRWPSDSAAFSAMSGLSNCLPTKQNQQGRPKPGVARLQPKPTPAEERFKMLRLLVTVPKLSRALRGRQQSKFFK